MADSYAGKVITALTEKTAAEDTDLFVVGDRGTATMKRFSFSALLSTIQEKLGTLTFPSLTTSTKTLPGAINELNSGLADVKSWTLRGSATGTTSVAIPSTAKDVLVNVQYNDTSTFFSFYLAPDVLASSGRTFTTGYYLSASAFAFVQIVASKTSVQLGTVSITGVTHTSTSHIYVYYR